MTVFLPPHRIAGGTMRRAMMRSMVLWSGEIWTRRLGVSLLASLVIWGAIVGLVALAASLYVEPIVTGVEYWMRFPVAVWWWPLYGFLATMAVIYASLRRG